jgi:tetrahydromethanopterin S-methyltransferase subunit G
MVTSLRIEFASCFGEVHRRLDETNRRLDAVESDPKDFFKVQAQFDQRLARIEDKLNIK